MHTLQSSNGTRHHLVEDVVRTLQSLLGDDTSFFQQVCLNIGTSQFTTWPEVNTDEFTLEEKKNRLNILNGLKGNGKRENLME